VAAAAAAGIAHQCDLADTADAAVAAAAAADEGADDDDAAPAAADGVFAGDPSNPANRISSCALATLGRGASRRAIWSRV